MIYACEWYDVRKTDHGYLVEYHPYLTKGDNARLQELNMEHTITQAVLFVLTGLIGNRSLLSQNKKWTQQRLLRTPMACLFGGVCTYAINYGIMRTVYLNDLKDQGMDKYFQFDLDADMMRNDLKEMDIHVSGKYFDMKQA